MSTIRRERNCNFFRWEPVSDGRFTKNAPIDWKYEIREFDDDDVFENVGDEAAADGNATCAEDEFAELESIGPSNDVLLASAKKHQAPQEWYDESIEGL